MLCENCSHICPEGSRFCPMCGTPLETVPPEPAVDCPILPEPEPVPEETPELSVPEASENTPEPAPEAPAEEVPVPEFQPLAPPAPKKGSALPPILIMAGMVILAFALFLITTAEPDHRTEIPWLNMDEDGLVTFVPEYYSGNWEITIPDTLDGRTVTGLADNSFAYSRVVTVILPDTLESIGTGAFRGCDGLRGIFIPEGVTSIAPYAFADCPALEAICIPSTVRIIGSQAFDNSGKLKLVFYSGFYADWLALYPDYICPHTYILCADGYYLQGSEAP